MADIGMQDSLNGNVTDSHVCDEYMFIYIHMYCHICVYICVYAYVYKCTRVLSPMWA